MCVAGSPSEYSGGGSSGRGTPKSKAQDVASKSLSGLESLVDQIPSIADGPSAPEPNPPLPALPDYAPALYPPYPPYGAPAYPNNGSALFIKYKLIKID